MKKHLLLIAALAVASSAYAGDIKMYMGEKEINPGTTYFNEISISDEGSYFDVMFFLVANSMSFFNFLLN